MELYKFEKIYKDMKKEFGKIKFGNEEAHTMMLFPIEGNALKVHRKYPSSNSGHLREAIALVLFKLKAITIPLYMTLANLEMRTMND